MLKPFMSNKLDYHELETLAQRGRWLAISTVAGSGAGHVGGPFSAMDMLIALYFRVMKRAGAMSAFNSSHLKTPDPSLNGPFQALVFHSP